MGERKDKIGARALLLIDHGSRVDSANRNLEEVAELLKKRGRFPIVIAAHMELARPTIGEGLRLCLDAGADEVVILPYFLAAGRHSASDIPRLVSESLPPGTSARVAIAEPLGIHEGLLDAVLQRAEESLAGRKAGAGRATGRLEREDSALVVVDVQERLLPHIFNRQSLTAATLYLIEGLKRLDVPILVTEQYPAGLGRTAPFIAQALPDGVTILEKTAFSLFGAPGLKEGLPPDRKTLILCGIETHVCVLQTALDALELGWRVAVVGDAVGSQNEGNHFTALERMCQAGGLAVSAEMLIFEFLRDAGSPEFKSLQSLLKAGPQSFGGR